MPPVLNGLKVYSTCPPSNLSTADRYLEEVRRIAKWSEDAGCEGILVYTDNGLVDPWLCSLEIIAVTERLAPLVAVQPVYLHPYSVAKMIASLAFLRGRRVDLNLVAGGFKNDLEALGDPTPHDERYARLVEYADVIARLVRGEPCTIEGRYYTTKALKLTPPVPPELRPGFFVSGSSEAGLAAARALSATAVQYPAPVAEYATKPPVGVAQSGIRVGIIARETSDEAWADARRRFPEDRRGQLTHQLAMKVSDSHWHRQISALGEAAGEESPYWTVPFENYKTFCPYLVGSHERVAEEVRRYVDVGFRTFILDVPSSPDELSHIGEVFRLALAPAR